ncbi:MAG: cyclodeaminase/cyclohydrolase family protein [Armatimonadota bacterium]|nr:cyclodeaminase/cyclohydrolase family protein [Armatimonadota bacterium]MDR7519519.1 cyclodeaminase/cyclohydrolase family protein [Armatimonadota bacterium]MDR7550043.1 cyclodeaminase/cyclohydrolase family protein [Armatimonadota bacterium]
MYPQMSISAFLARLASSDPEPGGGAAAALVAATGAALVGMVASLTIGKEKYAAVQAEMEQVRQRSQALVTDLAASIDRDAASFRKVMDAYRLPRGTDEEKAGRKQAIARALRDATVEPARVVRLCDEIATLSRVVMEQGNIQAVTDAAIAAVLADAAAQSAALNVKINLGPIGDPAFTDPLWADLRGTMDRIRAVRDEVLAKTYEKLG